MKLTVTEMSIENIIAEKSLIICLMLLKYYKSLRYYNFKMQYRENDKELESNIEGELEKISVKEAKLIEKLQRRIKI